MWQRLWVMMVLLSVLPAAAQPAPPEPMVELVFASSERQARVVERAMRTGFLIDQLLIPDTTYVGRRPLSELSPVVRNRLGGARPGEPQLLVLSSGNHLVARVLSSGPPAILGETEYAQDREAIWAVLAVGPTDVRLLSLEVDVETEDLVAVCRSKERLYEDLQGQFRQQVAALTADAPSAEVIQAYAALTSVHAAKGEMAEAIRVIGELTDRFPTQVARAEGIEQDLVGRFLGMLELRRGEVENCLHAHNREMCLFPLSEAARHRIGDGARRAFRHFSEVLEKEPTDLELRWLLNIAAMTIGTHPEGVPERFRIGPEYFVSSVDIGRFWDVGAPAGLAYSDNAGGSVADDFDGDGLIDLVVSTRDPCEPLRFYRNRGDGTFADETEVAGLAGQLGGLNVVQADYDNDGRLDLFVMRGGWETAIRDSLLRNRRNQDGGVRFEDVTARAGLGGPGHRTHSAAWADYDGDGWLDLFLGHEMSFSRLMRNRGDGTFEETTLEAGMRFRSLTKGAAWGDVNGDGRPDLYVSNFGERNLLFVNRGDGRFEETARDWGVEKPIYSFATWFWDHDNDGWQDLLVTSYLSTVDDVVREYLGKPQKGETMRVYRNRGNGSFEDVSAAAGMSLVIPSMGANFGDLDNDGYLDLYLGTGAPPYGMLIPNRMFLNQQGRRFVDVTTSTGTGHLQKGHGVSFADLDNDGDQDVFANLGGAFPGDTYPSALFENPGHGNDWIAIELVGERGNRAAIGARIRVVLDEKGRETQRVRWVSSGGSFGASPLMQHIGLGADARIRRIEIDWPRRTGDAGSERQVVLDVPVNSWIVVREGVPGFELAPRAELTLGAGAAHHPTAHDQR